LFMCHSLPCLHTPRAGCGVEISAWPAAISATRSLASVPSERRSAPADFLLNLFTGVDFQSVEQFACGGASVTLQMPPGCAVRSLKMFIVHQVDNRSFRCLRKTKRYCLGLVFLQACVLLPLPPPYRRG
jgi:hypothetical protein